MIASRDVAVIILNYENHEDTAACLKSLYGLSEKPGAIIVVDNASRDDSVQKIAASWKQWDTPYVVDGSQKTDSYDTMARAVLILHDKNNGYAEGNNVGIKFAQAMNVFKAYWILNNDTHPAGDALKALCDKCNNVNVPAVVGSTLIYAANPSLVQCAAGDRINQWFGTTAAVCGGDSLSDVLLMDEEAMEGKLDAVTGASMFIPDAVIRTAGMMREDFFLYVEDTEYALRLRRAGVPMLWAKSSLVFHREGGTTGAASANKQARPAWVDYLMLRNRARMMLDHFPMRFPVLCLSYAVVAMKRVARGQIDRVPLVAQALYHAFTGRMGRPSFLMK